MDEIESLQAEIMRTLAHPRRLQIIHLLATGPVEVGRIADDLGISQPNASQHLAVMRAVGVVEAERHGRAVSYRLSDPEVVAACSLMRGVLARRLARLAGLSGADRTPAVARGAEDTHPIDPPDRRPAAEAAPQPTAANRPVALATASTR